MLSKGTILIILITISAQALVVVYFNNKPTSAAPTEISSQESQINKGEQEDQVVEAAKEKKTEETTLDKIIVEPLVETTSVFTKDSLAVFNGEDSSLPIYIAFEGNVYDVTEGEKFYGPDGNYNFLAGTDSTKLLKVFGGDTIKNKYPVVGTFNP